ncbi:VOC family protein [Micromonospora sp. WMMD812]|uniref:VOC family protein n=1 Tax=Micromonospora sp. WMMD812 TaxID=3015152 RepID=UPI00248BF6B3|nr:VOC family protein [Micromonospora sp. WMMD812]WBB68502.1 VOC family protein [Micromonospora sp. WMMD812]
MTSTPQPSTVSIGLRTAAHVGISVRDLDRSVAFYQALLGADPVVRDETMQGPGFAQSQGLPTTKLRYATFNLDNLGIDLIQFLDPAGEPAVGAANRPGTMHLCFTVADVHAVHARMREAGFAFLGEPYTFAAGEVYPVEALGTEVAYFNDPDGTNLELIAPRVGSPGRSEPRRHGRNPARRPRAVALARRAAAIRGAVGRQRTPVRRPRQSARIVPGSVSSTRSSSVA